MKKEKNIKFLMGLHCHQPVDNFGHVFEDAYQKSYKPFLEVLRKHPAIKLSIHYSGSLLDWIKEKHPDFLMTIKELIEKQQVEILTGGHHEPILTMIPREDIAGQIQKLTDLITCTFGCVPKGAWLTERVWAPELAEIFKENGIDYTIVDDFHLTNAGVSPEKVFGRFEIENCENFSVFASIKKLRYSIPFSKNPKEVVKYLENIASDPRARLITFADDMEKFGLWPYTHDWVYRKGWLDRFFTNLEESKIVGTMTFSEAAASISSSGRIFMPQSSYAEMMHWSGGDFSNFFKKYPESNFMRKRMLHVSNLLKVSTCKEKIKEAKEELYKSQSNCSYWHGIFGGVYLKYLRQGVYKHLIKAETLIKNEESRSQPEVEIMRFPGDDNEIICARNEFLNIFVDPKRAGSIFEIDYKPRVYNAMNTMSRRKESYHENIVNPKSAFSLRAVKNKKGADIESRDLYAILGVKERNLKKWLFYDLYPKLSMISHVLPAKTSIADFMESRHCGGQENDSLLSDYRYSTEKTDKTVRVKLEKECPISLGEFSCNVRARKEVVLTGENRFSANTEITNTCGRAMKFLLATEFNWSVEDKLFKKARKLKNIRKLVLKDRYCGATVEHLFEDAVNAWVFPLYTLNESESGIGRNFQGSSVLFYRVVSLDDGQSANINAALKVYK